jgi:peptidyl-prolyl cis-trans isomerase B (cyclophilin B)
VTLRQVSAASLLVAACAAASRAQSALPTRLEIVQAELHGAMSTADLLLLRNAVRHPDGETARMAVRALGRTSRPNLLPDILPRLQHALPEVRAEAANAAAQAAQGFATLKTPPAGTTVQTTQAALIGRMRIEGDATVRAALCDAIARLPYRASSEIEQAEGILLDLASAPAARVTDRVAVARAFETLIRLHAATRPPGERALALLKGSMERPAGPIAHDLREARTRRLALLALIHAKAVSDDLVEAAMRDADPQVRRIAMRAAAETGAGLGGVPNGLIDQAPMVRIEALRALWERDAAWKCDAALRALSDSDMAVLLDAIDRLRACGELPPAVMALERLVSDHAESGTPRGWHRRAHALTALAGAAPDRARGAITSYAASPTWQLRMYAARAAAALSDRPALETLSADAEDRVANVALGALGMSLRPSLPEAKLAIPLPTVAELRRLTAPRAVITVRDVGRVELALFTSEAPAAVLRFVALAESGYYNGLTFDRVIPNGTVQGGGRTHADGGPAPPTEIGMWPHVRGVVGSVSTDNAGASFFINLVDDPSIDHRETAFAQVLNGVELIDAILEGDVIESIAIIP